MSSQKGFSQSQKTQTPLKPIRKALKEWRDILVSSQLDEEEDDEKMQVDKKIEKEKHEEKVTPSVSTRVQPTSEFIADSPMTFRLRAAANTAAIPTFNIPLPPQHPPPSNPTPSIVAPSIAVDKAKTVQSLISVSNTTNQGNELPPTKNRKKVHIILESPPPSPPRGGEEISKFDPYRFMNPDFMDVVPNSYVPPKQDTRGPGENQSDDHMEIFHSPPSPELWRGSSTDSIPPASPPRKPSVRPGVYVFKKPPPTYSYPPIFLRTVCF